MRKFFSNLWSMTPTGSLPVPLPLNAVYPTPSKTLAPPEDQRPEPNALAAGILAPLRQQTECLISSPAINRKVLIQRQDFASSKFFRQPNQAGVGEIDLPVPVFAQDVPYTRAFSGKLKRNLENAGNHVVDEQRNGKRLPVSSFLPAPVSFTAWSPE